MQINVRGRVRTENMGEKEEVMNNKRTDVNFDKHELTVVIDIPEVIIHKFKKSDSYHQSITFINTQGILAITGDYGNWIFCREFHPASDNFVSDSYWCEKLKISSTQKISDFDSKATRELIEKKLKGDDPDEEELEEDEKEYLEDILNYVDECEERYMVYAYDNLPKGRDYEFIPFIKKINHWLEVIFDAFDEICNRLKKLNEISL